MSTSPNVRPADSVMVRLERIPLDAAGQTRTKVRDAQVREYAAAMIEQLADGGLRFPPVILFQDGNDYALADGFHRVLAAGRAGLTEIAAYVRPGERSSLSARHRAFSGQQKMGYNSREGGMWDA